jgi:transcriptional regulator with XRE-family HTH domain
MEIGRTLRALREAKLLSQGDIERETGLLRCYVSRVEHGHTIPSIETLEKFARVLEIPLYRLFTDGARAKPPKPLTTTNGKTEWGSTGRQHGELMMFVKAFKRLDGRQRKILLSIAQKMASKNAKSVE